MLITTHVASGALIGRLVQRPLPAFLLGFASHFALDHVPHWGRPARPGAPTLDEEAMRVAVVDGLTGLALVAAVAVATPRRHRLPVLVGITGACLPDMDKPGELFAGRSPFPRWVDALHRRVQRESPDRFLQEVATAGAGAAAALGALGAERAAG